MLAKRLRVLQTFTREPDEVDMHFIGLVLVIGTIGMLNLRVFGKQVPISALNRLVPWGIAGFGMNVVTGLLAFISMPTFIPTDLKTHSAAFSITSETCRKLPKISFKPMTRADFSPISKTKEG